MDNVLIIEDDQFKAKSLEQFIIERNEFLHVRIVTSLVEAIEAIEDNNYGLILIDMAIPSHPLTLGGGSPISLLTGGLEVLMELSALERTDPCIIITQYPDIEVSGQFYSLNEAKNQIEKQLECSVLSCIEYKEADNTWKKSLTEVLNNK